MYSTFAFWLDAFPSLLFPKNRVHKTAGISVMILLCTCHSVLCKHSKIIALESTWARFELSDIYRLTIRYVSPSWYSWNTPKKLYFWDAFTISFKVCCISAHCLAELHRIEWFANLWSFQSRREMCVIEFQLKACIVWVVGVLLRPCCNFSV